MSDTKPDNKTRPPEKRRKELFQFRSLLLGVLFGCLATLLLLWSLGVRLDNGAAVAALVAVIVGSASLGEFVRQRFQLSLRLWLIAFTALAVLFGLSAQYLVEVTKQRQAVARVYSLGGGGEVTYDYQDDGVWFRTRAGLVLPNWLRGVLGNDLCGRVDAVYLPANCRDEDLPVICNGLDNIYRFDARRCPNITDKGLQYLVDLKQLNSVLLNAGQATEIGLQYLAELPELERLHLKSSKILITDDTLANLHLLPQLRHLVAANSTGVTDAGMEHVTKLKNLESLNLTGTAVGDAGVKQLSRLTNLQLFALDRTAVSDSSVVHLSEMSNLHYLLVQKTAITKQGATALKEALPGCGVRH